MIVKASSFEEAATVTGKLRQQRRMGRTHSGSAGSIGDFEMARPCPGVRLKQARSM
jgi:hypothetical protein